MKSILIALVACFPVVGLLGCTGGACATPPDIRLQWPVMLERTVPSVPGPRLVPQTVYAAPTYAPVGSPYAAPCAPAPTYAAPCP